MSVTVRMKVKCTSREESEGTRYDVETRSHIPARMFAYRFAFVSGTDSHREREVLECHTVR